MLREAGWKYHGEIGSEMRQKLEERYGKIGIRDVDITK